MRSRGFTLIELIIVIVILGILAVTAAPKFLDLKTDANLAKVKSLQGTVTSASTLVHSKAIVKWKANETTGAGDNGLLISTTEIKLVNGYPEASEEGIIAALDLDIARYYPLTETADRQADWYYYPLPGLGVMIELEPGGYACAVLYQEATTERPPGITPQLSECDEI